jgi:diguanylate cyclase (GGDEF)-like protein
MFSLKIKLVAYFLVLATLPLAAGYWGFASSVAGNERGRADERLSAELRAASTAYREKLAEARSDASALAENPALHEALVTNDTAAIERLAVATTGIQIRSGTRTYGARTGTPAARITVRNEAGTLGEVVTLVPVGAALGRSISVHAGLGPNDSLVVAHGSRITSGPGRGELLPREGGRTRSIDLGGASYFAVVGSGSIGGVSIAAVTPLAPIQAAAASARQRLLIGVFASLLLIALVAYVEGAAIVRTVRRFVVAAQAIAKGSLDERVPVKSRDEFGQLGYAFNDMADQLEAERRRLSLATMRFGEALAATHDTEQLLRVIVTTAVESTRATAGVVRGRNGDVAWSGTPIEGDQIIEVPLAVRGESFGTLVLTGLSFSDHDREVAQSLASHAVTALENARLHEIVKRQALLDSLTGMPNRRQCETALATELSRAKRFGGPLAFVLADLDEFKTVNDRHGHVAGDRVLREFSDILRELVREADVAARWGGEEFALVLPNTDAQGAAVLVERIRSTLEHRTIGIDGHSIGITASFGVAVYPDEESAEELIEAADKALYVAKRAGKNRVETSTRLRLTA